MKKKGFKNPSNYSFINFSKLVVENMHRRNPLIAKNLNKLSKKIESIFYYDSIVSINFSSKNQLKKTILLENDSRKRDYFVDFRHNGSFINTLHKFEKLFGKINEETIIFKIIRKLFHRNLFITLNEKIKIKKYMRLLKS
jgi:hypothetical protein|tara:strand:+ start:19 stop:438 length:420 start_codon:yes stop_codon:yes gene_type:complete